VFDKNKCPGVPLVFLLIVFKYFRVLLDPKQGLIVGLGGGGLAMFFYQYFKQVKTTIYCTR